MKGVGSCITEPDNGGSLLAGAATEGAARAPFLENLVMKQMYCTINASLWQSHLRRPAPPYRKTGCVAIRYRIIG